MPAPKSQDVSKATTPVEVQRDRNGTYRYASSFGVNVSRETPSKTNDVRIPANFVVRLQQ
jgi:hypothetical protein